MKYLHLFQTQSAQTEAYKWIGGKYDEPWVDLVAETKEVHYNLPPMDWSTQYLTFKALENGTFNFSGNPINYSIDGGETWVELAANTNTPTVSAGGTIMFKATLTPTTTGIGKFSSSGKYKAMGNPYSLLYGDNFEGEIDLTGKNYALYGLFSGSSGLTSAENLSLPATTLTQSCYSNMFNHCTSLKKAPELPATTLAQNCYWAMFAGCTSLTSAPELPATTLAQSCYGIMFTGCTSLTTTPELPATTLYAGCYDSMFKDCTSLDTASALPATALASRCYYFMFYGCTKLSAAPALPATTLASSCYMGMFASCASLASAPELPATTLASYCYNVMFDGCTSLNYIKAMFTTTPSTTYTQNWVSGVASSGTFVKNSAATWTTTGFNGIPTGWTVETASA